MTALIFGLFGLIVGSFLNVVILRHGQESVGGRSACPKCHKQLHWYDMIPVVSWLVLRGRCRSCRARISVQYPLVEAITGTLFGVIGASALPYFVFPFDTQLLACAIIGLLICISVYDIYHTIIPDVWVWPFVALSLIFSALLLMRVPDASFWWLLAAGPIASFPLFSLWLVSRGAWMGFGDVKLALGIGWLLGFPFGLVAIFFSFVIGAVISVGILLPLPHIVRALGTVGITSLEASDKGFTITSEVPFGPFIVASCLLVWFALLYNIPIPLFSYYG